MNKDNASMNPGSVTDKRVRADNRDKRKRARKMSGWILGSVVVAALLVGTVASFAFRKTPRDGSGLTYSLSEPLNNVKAAKFDINAGPGNLTVDSLGLAVGESPEKQLLVGGTLQYLESQGQPTCAMKVTNGQALFTARTGGRVRQGFRLPWDACKGGAYEWRIRLNPVVASDITAHSDGGNIKLDLTAMVITHLTADTGGGNVDLTLPADTAATIRATSGLGKVSVDRRFTKVDADTYQSPAYRSANAAHRVEITLSSGMGNVSVRTS